MERLTKEKQIGPFASLKDEAEAVPGAFATYDCLYSHMVAVTRLKEYEDTGLTPEDIEGILERGTPLEGGTAELMKKYLSIGTADHFQKLAQAEKDGRLVVLPCKPGTELFTHCHVRGAYPIAHSYFYPPYIPTLGKNAWLTREEAEAALKKREEADNEAD